MKRPDSVYEALMGRPDPGVVEFRIRPLGKRTTRWEVACLEPGCDDKGTASSRGLASQAAGIHAMTAHEGRRARIRVGKPRRT